MSILETFFILFKTDADQAAKDIGKVDDASDKAAAGLVKMDVATEAVSASFRSMAAAIAGPILALASAGSMLSIAVARAAEVRELDQFSSKLNASVADVDAFQRSVKGMGGETAAALDSLSKIAEKVNEAFSDAESGARKDFKAWGLAFKDAKGNALGASDAMLELAKNLEGVSRAEALARIKKLGIEDAASIDLLLRGRAALEEKIRAEKDLGVVTKEQAENVRRYYGELGRAQNALTSIGNQILTTLIPVMIKGTQVLADFAGWVSKNGTLVAGFFIGVAGVLTAVYLPAITAAATATLAATWPFIAVGAAIAAVGAIVALVYEDIVMFLNGQPSLIGKLAEKYEWVAAVIKGIGVAWGVAKSASVTAIADVSEVLKSLGDIAKTVVSFVASGASTILTAWYEIQAPMFQAWSNLFKAIGEVAAAFFGRVTEFFASLGREASSAVADITRDFAPLLEFFQVLASKIPEVFRVMVGVVKDIFSGLFGWIADGINSVASRISGVASWIRGDAPAQPAANDNAAAAGASVGHMMGRGQSLAAGASGAAINTAVPGAVNTVNTSNVSVGNVTVNTQATDARAVAGAVRGELQRQLRGTAAQFDDGVDR